MKLVDCSVVLIAPSNITFRLLLCCLKPLGVTVVCEQETNIQKKHYAFGSHTAYFFFRAVKLRCQKDTAVVIMKLVSPIMWHVIMVENSCITLWYDAISIA